MPRRLKAILRNPITIVVPIVLVALFGWRYYIHTLNEPSHAQHNLLAQQDNFESHGAQDVPDGWSPSGTNQADYSFATGAGYEGGTATAVHLLNSQDGSLDLTSPAIPVTSGQTYLYKAYYESNAPFYLLVKYYYKNGTTSLQLINQYSASTSWTTDSVAFKADATTTQVQVEYKLSTKGTVWFDKAYMDQRSSGIYVASQPAVKPNLIKNSGLSQQANSWGTISTGVNNASFQVLSDAGTPYLRTQIATYASGGAAWTPTEVPVSFGANMQFSLNYRSTTAAQLQAVYSLKNGTTQTVILYDLPSARDWTQVQATADAPVNSTNVSLQAVLSSQGTLDSRSYNIQDFTMPGTRTFTRPLVSIVFSDGWASSYTTAGRIMDFVGYKGTYYINPASIDTGSFLTSGQLHDLTKSGNQVASEGYDYVDLTDLNSQQLERQMWLSKDYFTGEFGSASVDFAPTFGHSDPEVSWYTRQYFRSSLSSDEGINTKQNIDDYNLKTLYIDSNTTPARFQAALNQTISSDGWLILVYHRVDDGSTSSTTVSSKEFTGEVEQINQSGVTVKTVAGALSEIQGQ